jgi:hypothetical protein
MLVGVGTWVRRRALILYFPLDLMATCTGEIFRPSRMLYKVAPECECLSQESKWSPPVTTAESLLGRLWERTSMRQVDTSRVTHHVDKRQQSLLSMTT